MNQDTEEPMAPIAGKLIQLKRSAEQAQVLPTTVFEGFGTKEEGSTDPVAWLRNIVKERYAVDERKERKRKLQKGGNPLLAVGLPVVGALASEIVKDLYNVIKRKIFGGEINHKTVQSQKHFIKFKHLNILFCV